MTFLIDIEILELSITSCLCLVGLGCYPGTNLGACGIFGIKTASYYNVQISVAQKIKVMVYVPSFVGFDFTFKELTDVFQGSFWEMPFYMTEIPPCGRAFGGYRVLLGVFLRILMKQAKFFKPCPSKALHGMLLQ